MESAKPRPLSSELLPLQYKTALSVLELSRVTVCIRKIMREPNFISQVVFFFFFFDSLMFSLFFFFFLHQTLLQLPPAMVEESEEVQSQETELETEEEAMPAQADIVPDKTTDASSSQETSASETETTPNQTGASSSPEATPADSEITGTGLVTVPAENNTTHDVISTPGETE